MREVRPGFYVTVTVSDNGFGLTAEAEQHLFEPFFTTKGPGKGTGLGLPMVYGVVRARGGGIEVRNHPGNGVAFEIFLPVASAVSREKLPAPAIQPPRGTERVLIIDDEEALRR
jgi:signal transduction histidine kinase